MSKNNSKLLSTNSSSRKPPLPFGFPISRNSNSTLNNFVSNTDLLTPNRPTLIDNNASSLSSHSRSPSTSSMIFGTIESNSLNIDNFKKPNNLSSSILSKTKSIDVDNSNASYSNKNDIYMEKNQNIKSKLKSASLSSNLSSHTGSMASKLNKDLTFNSFNNGAFSIKSNEKKLINSSNTLLGRSGVSGNSAGASSSGISKKKKLTSALTLPSFFIRKRHSIESLIEYCKIS